VELLDDIIDIFIAKGWVGFYKILLFIFDSIKDQLIGASYEDILLILGNIPRDSFHKIFKKGIDLKKEILRYKKVK